MSYQATINEIDAIRMTFAEMLYSDDFVVDKTGVKMLEILGAQFIADEDSIFGKPIPDYLERELKWYLTMEQNIAFFPEPVPALWKSTAGQNGETNSNYGWAVFHEQNHRQFLNVRNELGRFPHSRRAIMIYTRPSMHTDFQTDGKSDFMCTNSVQYFIRNDYLHAYVSMRSNDAVFGYKADHFWQDYVHRRLHTELSLQCYPDLKLGRIVWNAGSLHVYERHFNLVRKYWDEGKHK